MQGTLAENHTAHGDSCVAYVLSATNSSEEVGDGYSEHLIHDRGKALAHAQRLAAEGRHVFMHRIVGTTVDHVSAQDKSASVLAEYKPLPVLFPWAV